MHSPDAIDQLPRSRPKRADAQRNYDKVVAAAREAFAEGGASTSLEEIVRRAQVGIGTLYRHFPSRRRDREDPSSEPGQPTTCSTSRWTACATGCRAASCGPVTGAGVRLSR